ncbi:endonuclease/exonuclease/phosphatase family protein [Nocardia cyriacigeorgica]|uniref:endonuclease/exonuclease/phosphatase family protein n=1 Tax=Nocardia cyriacigeorgica TaxID=135487 RepID=UPI002457B201|nr:endonuclease/exonuclease/phosphatase family protein [Nocardia cyriacigeorgica]
MRIWVNRALLGTGWVALLAGIAGIALYFSGSQRRTVVLLASGASLLMVGTLVALVLFAIARGRRSMIAAALAAAAALWTQVPIYVPDGHAATGPELIVMQSNLLFGEADTGAVVDAVRAQRVDVLTVNELTPAAVAGLAAAGIGTLLPYHYLEDSEAGGVGTGIYSRYPLRDTTNYDGFLLNNISAIMDHPDRGAIAVYAFHPVPPPLDFGRWQRELSAIRDILELEQRPAIVGADFNATRDHSAFRELLRGRFESAADQAGAGPLRSYPQDRRWGPVIGIDHVLLADATADEVWTMVVPGTDHRAVLARTRLH